MNSPLLSLTLKCLRWFPVLSQLKHEGYKPQNSFLCEVKLLLMTSRPHLWLQNAFHLELQGSILQALNPWYTMQWSNGSKLGGCCYKTLGSWYMGMSKHRWPHARIKAKLSIQTRISTSVEATISFNCSCRYELSAIVWAQKFLILRYILFASVALSHPLWPAHTSPHIAKYQCFRRPYRRATLGVSNVLLVLFLWCRSNTVRLLYIGVP